jgi:hypothetical protein
MSTTIKYTNFHGEPISEKQLEMSDSYSKQIYENNVLKKIEDYVIASRINQNVVLRGGEYYLSPSENLQTVLNELLPTARRWTIYFDRQTNSFGDYYWEYRQYNDGVLERNYKEVFNALNQMILESEIDVETNQVLSKRKSFYGNPNGVTSEEDEVHLNIE